MNAIVSINLGEIAVRVEDRDGQPWLVLADDDRMMELNLSDPEALQHLLDERTDRTELEPKAAALDQLASAEGSLCITDAAKAIGVAPRRLFEWMETNGWIYRRSGSSHWAAFQSRITAGLLEHKTTRLSRPGRLDKLIEQVMVTPKGLTRLATDHA